MNTIHVLSIIDGFVLVVIIWCAIDGSRQVSWLQEPMRALTFAIAGIGTLSYLIYREFNTVEEALSTLASHVGFAMYAINHAVKRYKGRRITDGRHSLSYLQRHH